MEAVGLKGLRKGSKTGKAKGKQGAEKVGEKGKSKNKSKQERAAEKQSTEQQGKQQDAKKAKKVYVDSGKQGKHQHGHNNWKPGKSIIDHKDPQSLADRFSGKGQRVAGEPGKAGFRERVNFKEDIGWYVDPTSGRATKTTIGIIHHGKDGVHIVPARPN